MKERRKKGNERRWVPPFPSCHVFPRLSTTSPSNNHDRWVTEEVRRGNHSLLSSIHFLTVFPSREGEGEGWQWEKKWRGKGKESQSILSFPLTHFSVLMLYLHQIHERREGWMEVAWGRSEWGRERPLTSEANGWVSGQAFLPRRFSPFSVITLFVTFLPFPFLPFHCQAILSPAPFTRLWTSLTWEGW